MNNAVKHGILLTNLGTPAAPTKQAVRRYLAEFLSDPYVVQLPRWLWWPILWGIILPFRPQRSAKAYQAIWTEQGSPLLTISKKQQQALQQLFDQQPNKNAIVALGMRYGEPSIERALQQLHQAGVTDVTLLPLYPQYAAATTGSTENKVAEVLQKMQWSPILTTVSHYADNATYVAAIAESIQTYWQQHGRAGHLLFSFHGLPEKVIAKGDPYRYLCEKTAGMLAEKLQLEKPHWQLVFQSRIGGGWLQPYCDATLIKLAKQGCKSVDIVCPGFPADCLETLEEIAIRGKKTFLAAGGETLRYIPALNDSPMHIQLMLELLHSPMLKLA